MPWTAILVSVLTLMKLIFSISFFAYFPQITQWLYDLSAVVLVPAIDKLDQGL